MARPISSTQTVKLLLALAIAVLGGCAPSRWVRPLEKGQVAVSANLGGPMIILGDIPLFIPLTSIAAGYGLNDKITLSGGLHTTALAFGVIHSDIGAVYAPFQPDGWKPGLSGFAGINPMVDVWEGNFRCYPQLDLNAWWTFGAQDHHLVYAGFSGWGNLTSSIAYSRSNPNMVIPAFQAGTQFRNGNWTYGGELKWIAMNRNPERTVVDYISPGMGAIGLHLSVARYFGGSHHE